MESTTYTQSRKESIYRYHAKCKRIQVVLNPETESDAEILRFLNTLEQAPDATKVKRILLKYIALQKATKYL